MKKLILVFGILLIYTSTNAQDTSSDPFDLSNINSQIEEIGLPTYPSVRELYVTAQQLYDLENCTEAIPAFESLAKNANWLANMITSGLEPYYDASYDDRKAYPYSKAQKLIPIESKANNLKEIRNIAFVRQANCHTKLANNNKAVALYIKALELIDIDNEELWNEARTGLYNIIEVDY